MMKGKGLLTGVSASHHNYMIDPSGASGSARQEVLQGIPVHEIFPDKDIWDVVTSPYYCSNMLHIPDLFDRVLEPVYTQSLQRELDVTSAELLPAKLDFMLNREYENWYNWYNSWYINNLGGGSFVPSPLEQLNYPFHFCILIIFIAIICIFIFWRIKNKKRKNEKCEESKPSCTGVPRQGPASSGSQTPDTDRRVPSPLSLSLLQPSFLMSKTRSYAQILIGSRLFLTAMAIHLSLRVAPLDLQQGGNSRIPYVHVPAARMSILVYITTALNTFFLNKKSYIKE
ncbi:ATP synthase subunit H protein (Va0H) (atp6H) (Atp6v0e) [Orobanche minor]